MHLVTMSYSLLPISIFMTEKVIDDDEVILMTRMR